MSRLPPEDNNRDEFDIIENAMNSMMQGAFSSLFRQLMDSTVFETDHLPMKNTVTIIDGNTRLSHTPMDDYGGDDFKKLAHKHKQNKEIIKQNKEENKEVLPIKSVFNRLFHHNDHMESKEEIVRDIPKDDILHKNNNAQWIFTSSSQKTVYQPDGSQITTITTKTNDKTETIERIKYPDGHIEERRQEMANPSLWDRIWRK